jgi:hypothetical protein
LIHFELIFVLERQRSSFSLLHADVQFFQEHLLKRLSFLHQKFWTPLSKIRWLTVAAWIYVLYFVPLIFMSVFIQYHAVFFCLFVYGTGVWTKGLMLTKQVLWHLSHSASPLCYFYCYGCIVQFTVRYCDNCSFFYSVLP